MSVSPESQQRKDDLLSAFLGMVRSRDGDFGALGQLSQASSDPETLDLLINSLRLEPVGKSAFDNYTRLGEVDLESLELLPSNTLGYVYANHMKQNNLKPLEIKPSNNDYEFLGAHISETHDIWHVITGFNTDLIGELKLEAFYVCQLPVSFFDIAFIVTRTVQYHQFLSRLHQCDRLTQQGLIL